jgi:UrcA family protein
MLRARTSGGIPNPTVRTPTNLTKRSDMRHLSILAFAVVAACSLTVSHAQDSTSPRTETVRYADLDLNNPEGAVTLFRRLHTAAADVCTQPADGTGYAAVPLYKNCVDRALGGAVLAVDQPALTAYAQARGIPVAGASARPN